MPISTYTSALQFLGLAKEADIGDPTAMDVTVPVEEFSPDQSWEQLKDASWRGSMAATNDVVQGTTKTEFDFKGPAFGDTLGHWLLNILGDLTSTEGETGEPNTHAFSLLNSGQGQPATHTLTHFQGPAARQIPGACLSELTLKWSAESELFTAEGKGTGFGTVLLGSTPTAAPSTMPALASWRAKLGIGGVASGGTLVDNVAELELSIKRNLKPYWTLTGGQDPATIARGTLEVTGKMTFIAASEAPFLAYAGHTKPQLQLVIDNGGSGAGLVKCQIDIAKAAYSTSKFSGGNESAEYETEFEAVGTTTNAGASGGTSPLKVTLSNGVTSY